MVAKAGINFLLREGTLASGTNVAGLRTTSFNINNEAVEITNKDSNRFRTLLAGAGTKSLTISADGVFDDVAVAETVRGYAEAGSINPFTLIFNSDATTGDTIEGSFQITSYERSSDQSTEETFSVTLESSGSWTYNADQSV